MFIKIILLTLSMGCISFGSGDEGPQQPSQPDEVGQKRKTLENSEAEDTQDTSPEKKQKTEEEDIIPSVQYGNARKNPKNLLTLIRNYSKTLQQLTEDADQSIIDQLIQDRYKIYEEEIKIMSKMGKLKNCFPEGQYNRFLLDIVFYFDCYNIFLKQPSKLKNLLSEQKTPSRIYIIRSSRL